MSEIIPSVSTSIEHCALRIHHSTCTFNLCCIYRRPSTNVTEWTLDLYTLLDDLTSSKFPLLLVGDFNINLLNNTEFADEMYASYYLKQFIQEPTRVAAKSATLIDHIYCSDSKLMSMSGVINLHLSDHNLTFCDLNIDGKDCHRQTKCVSCRAMWKVDRSKLLSDLSQQTWSLINIFDEIDDAVDCFTALFMDVWNRHAPLKKKHIRFQKLPSMTRSVKSAMKKRDKLYKKHCKCRSDTTWLDYKTTRNQSNIAIRTAKR